MTFWGYHFHSSIHCPTVLSHHVEDLTGAGRRQSIVEGSKSSRLPKTILCLVLDRQGIYIFTEHFTKIPGTSSRGSQVVRRMEV